MISASVVLSILRMTNVRHFSSFVAPGSHLQEHFQECGHTRSTAAFGYPSPSGLTYFMLNQSVVNKDRFPNYIWQGQVCLILINKKLFQAQIME